ncbi:MAG: DNA repair protein RadC [Bacteroidaceae bacterium]|nr:DNA repair protein RadC [Bacteroidaceae bacterium]
MSAEKLSITQWNEADRPREKLMAQGPQALSSAELLAILIGSGSPSESAVDLTRRLLSDCRESLKRLGRMTVAELCQYNGIGQAKAVTIMAACEFGRRRASEMDSQKPQIASSADIFQFYIERMQDLPIEEFHVMLLTQNLRFIDSKLVSRGGISSTAVDVRVLLKEALLAGATCIALCHNHPGGGLRPSLEDDKLTQRIKQAAELLNIRVIDHLIISEGRFYSYADEGKL